MNTTGVALYATRLVVVAVIMSLVYAAWALAQDPVAAAKSIPTDFVPAWAFYSVLGLASAAGGVLGKVIYHLWTRIGEERQAHLVSVKEMAATHGQAMSGLAILLSGEQKAHLSDVERLKGESAEFGRESIKQLAVNSEGIEDLTAVVTQLKDYLKSSEDLSTIAMQLRDYLKSRAGNEK